MAWKEFFFKNKKILIILIIILGIVTLISTIYFFFIKTDTYSTLNNSSSVLQDQNNNFIEEKEIRFEELSTLIDDIQKKYPPNISGSTKLSKGLSLNEYYSNTDDLNNAYALICINQGYNVSSKIKSPIFIYIPDLKTEDNIKDNYRYYDVNLNDLKQYCKDKNKTIYIFNILDLPPKTQSQTPSSVSNTNNFNETQKTVEKILLSKLDDLFENEFFKSIKNNISPSCLDRLSDQPDTGSSLNTVLIVKKDQDNSIPRTDDNHKMIIYVELTDQEKTDNKYYQDSNNVPNKIFNKKYNDLTLEDIQNTKNRKIYIFQIKYYDYKDKDHNPLSESFLG
ncbi:MAG: hypothetical protein ACLTFB_01315 [Candidatus Phytoplasma pyri]